MLLVFFFCPDCEESLVIRIHKVCYGVLFSEKTEGMKLEVNITTLICPYNLFILLGFRYRKKPGKILSVTENFASFEKNRMK